jgi:hypothetical protein
MALCPQCGREVSFFTRDLASGFCRECLDNKKKQDKEQRAATIKCPWCSQEMTPGKLYGCRYALQWLNHDQGLVLGNWALGGDPVGYPGPWRRPYAVGHGCLACKKIVIDESRTE